MNKVSKKTLEMLAKVAVHEACEKKFPCVLLAFQPKRPVELYREHR